eukprot:gnl/Dysnectes_brevis/6781_a10779_284.p1 GENE.gnl/Dysnectes_brevis/6781_a10779_284~~gnl/Dysnectes_brevis/6781_a10779_284.p1  ORF type:complete len:426 (+),score=30.75 gnl/Dysnectes_brevis/6781_a10779_284:251-1528(+)
MSSFDSENISSLSQRNGHMFTHLTDLDVRNFISSLFGETIASNLYLLGLKNHHLEDLSSTDAEDFGLSPQHAQILSQTLKNTVSQLTDSNQHIIFDSLSKRLKIVSFLQIGRSSPKKALCPSYERISRRDSIQSHIGVGSIDTQIMRHSIGSIGSIGTAGIAGRLAKRRRDSRSGRSRGGRSVRQLVPIPFPPVQIPVPPSRSRLSLPHTRSAHAALNHAAASAAAHQQASRGMSHSHSHGHPGSGGKCGILYHQLPRSLITSDKSHHKREKRRGSTTHSSSSQRPLPSLGRKLKPPRIFGIKSITITHSPGVDVASLPGSMSMMSPTDLEHSFGSERSLGGGKHSFRGSWIQSPSAMSTRSFMSSSSALDHDQSSTHPDAAGTYSTPPFTPNGEAFPGGLFPPVPTSSVGSLGVSPGISWGSHM